MAENIQLRGSRPRELPRANRTYDEGRVCARAECETRLSKYNKSKYCWAHTPVKYPLTRGERRKRKAAA